MYTIAPSNQFVFFSAMEVQINQPASAGEVLPLPSYSGDEIFLLLRTETESTTGFKKDTSAVEPVVDLCNTG